MKGCFKVGDKVRILRACSGTEVGEIIELTANGSYNLPHAKYCNCGNDIDGYWELITEKINNKKQTIMNKLSLMMKKLLDNDLQVLVKAGYINENLELTTDGKVALDSVLFDANKVALVKLAQEKLDEEKENK